MARGFDERSWTTSPKDDGKMHAITFTQINLCNAIYSNQLVTNEISAFLYAVYHIFSRYHRHRNE